jgi:hypothetical protein
MSSSTPSSSSFRGRGRGNRGKTLRARGRRGFGRPAEFNQRLVLEDEELVELDPDEAKEFTAKYARRELGSNADRYEEPPPPDKNADGTGTGGKSRRWGRVFLCFLFYFRGRLDPAEEEEPEPEVDLSAFLERQRLSDAPSPLVGDKSKSKSTADFESDDDVDHSLAHIGRNPQSRKGQVQQLELDDKLEDLIKQKESADAVRGQGFHCTSRTMWLNTFPDLKARFKGNAPATARSRYGKLLSFISSVAPSQLSYLQRKALYWMTRPQSRRRNGSRDPSKIWKGSWTIYSLNIEQPPAVSSDLR